MIIENEWWKKYSARFDYRHSPEKYAERLKRKDTRNYEYSYSSIISIVMRKRRVVGSDYLWMLAVFMCYESMFGEYK